MIGPKMHIFKCDDCGTQEHFYDISQAREKQWAVARDRIHCYCPNCAPARRYLGCCGRQQTKRIKPPVLQK